LNKNYRQQGVKYIKTHFTQNVGGNFIKP